MSGMVTFFAVVLLGYWGAMVSTAVLDGPPQGESRRVWLPALGLTLLAVALLGAGLWWALGPARLDALLLVALSLGGHSWHHGPVNPVDRVTALGLLVLLLFPALLRWGCRRAKRRGDEAVTAAIARWGRPRGRADAPEAGTWPPPPEA